MTYINLKSKDLIKVKNIKVKHKFDTLVTKSVNITEDQVRECKNYAENYIKQNKNYKDLAPTYVKDENVLKQLVKQRVFIDKIGECAVLNYFKYRGLNSDVLKDNKINIKTYVDKDIHNRIIIDKKEIQSKSKYYIGAHLNLEVEDKKHPVKKYLTKGIYDIKRVQIYGYVEAKFIDSLRYDVLVKKDGKKEHKFYTKKASNYDKKNKYDNFGFDCKWYYLDRMMEIENLVMKIKNSL